MNFTDAVKTVLTQKYADFNGRASRSEFWWYVLFTIIASLVLQMVDNAVIGLPVLASIFALATLIPGIAVSVRRLHDKDKSGWFLLLALIPIVGAIMLIYWYATEGTSGNNQYGGAPAA